MRRKISFLLVISLILSLYYFPVPAVAAHRNIRIFGSYTAVTNPELILRDNVVDRPVSYFIRFTTPHTLMGGRDTVTLKFPQGINISSNITAGNVSCNSRDVAGLDLSNNILTLTVPSAVNILAGEEVEIGIAGSVIRNPREAGYYQIALYTSQDTKEVKTEPFYITDFEYSNGVSKPKVSISTGESGKAPVYRISFKTSPNGRLTGGVDKIFLTFPSGAEMPGWVDGRCITINGYTLYGQTLTIEGNKITLQLPAGLTIPANGAVELVISSEAQIKNPRVSAYNTIRVATSAETREITSFPYKTEEGSSSAEESKAGLSVVVTPDGAGQQAAYTITIKPGLLYRFDSTITGLVLAFPSGTEIPSAVSKEHVKVNGRTAAGVLVNTKKGELIFTLDETLSSNEQIVISIDRAAGIKNPGPAQYKLDVGVLRSAGTILSDWYVIKTASSSVIPPGTTPVTVNKTVRLRVDSILAEVDNLVTVLDAAPAIVSNVTLVPLRFVADALGATTEYNSAGSYVTVKYGTKEMTLWVNSKLAKVNGAFVSLAAPASMINNRLMVPIRFVSENFGAQVAWDGTTRSITITQGNGSGSSNSTPVNQYPIGYKAYVKAEHSYVNVRSGPGTHYPLAGKVLKGEYMMITGTEGDWYKVKLTSGEAAWVASWVVDVRT
ncbi:MAG: stalk domain-containing protein [Bacillota bacterium]